MLLFVYEFLCGGGLNGSASPSLQREGWMMLDAVLQDFGRCPGVETVTLLDASRPRPPFSWLNNQVVEVEPGNEEALFRALAARADATLVIAPEFDEFLLTRCRWVNESGGRLLGPTLAAIALTGDKWRLAAQLRQHNVPTPRTLLWNDTNGISSYPALLKPRDGAGSQATFLLHDSDDLARANAQLTVEAWQGEMIVQPYCPGLAASVALLVGAKEVLALPAAAQHLSTDDRFHYLGGEVPLSPELTARAQRLGRQAVAAVAGLAGYVGVDVVLGETIQDDVVIEINPRLTTAYAGYRQLARFNLAAALLAVTRGTPLPDLQWHPGPIRFSSTGV